MTGRLLTGALFVLALAITGCNATGATPSPLPTSPPATRAPTNPPPITTPEALRGIWTADISGTSASSGLWTMEISESNVLLQNPVGGDLFSVGPTAMTETSLVVAADPDCPGQSTVTPGTYTLALVGDRLRITLESDSCGDRSGVLSSAPWTKKP
jgi:hypothetical protein